MKFFQLAVSLVACLGADCATAQSRAPAPQALPDCFARNYDPARHLFTLKDAARAEVNQQCLLTVWPHGSDASGTRITAGRYLIYLSDGGDGGAGGTLQDNNGGGGGGGGGAGARELQMTVDLVEGVYKLTMGAGGPGGNPCIPSPIFIFSGGPGWLGSPSSVVHVATGKVLVGTPGADLHARPNKRGNEKKAGNPDGHGGSGPGKTSGGVGGHIDVTGFQPVVAKPGESKAGQAGGDAGVIVGDPRKVGSGGGGGASTLGEGGDGGGETRRHWVLPPERGTLGSGGGGGEGTPFVCGAGATGGNGFVAFRALDAQGRVQSAEAGIPALVPSPARTLP